MRGIAILPSVRWPLRRASREEARLLARNDGSPRPDGVFRPEAERKIRQGLIEGIGRHNAERSVMDDIAAEPEREFVALRSDSPSVLGAPPARVTAEVKTGQRPYADISDFQLAAYQNAAASELLAAGPAFEPGPSIAPVTEPLPVLPGNAKTPPPPPAALGRRARPPAAEVPDLAVLRDVRHGLARKQQAERAERFSADRRELRFFSALTKELGWQGLHMPVRSLGRQFGHQRWTTERWAARERALADADLARAQAELDAVHARYAAEAVVEGGSR